MRYLLIIGCWLLAGWATDATGQSTRQWVKLGDRSAKDGDAYGAAQAYQNAFRKESSDLGVAYKMAEAIRAYRNYPEAEKAYQLVYDKDAASYPESLFWLATMKKYRGAYDEAGKDFNQFRKRYRDKASFFARKAKQEIKSCQAAKSIIKDTNAATVENLGTGANSFDSEFAPLLVNDSTLIFSALHFRKPLPGNRVGDENAFIQLYQATRQGGQWKTTGPLPPAVNDSTQHVGNGTFSADGTQFVFSKCDENYQCDLYVVKRYADGWGEAERMAEPVNLEGFSTTQPMFAEVDRKTVLYFVSNRPRGKGKLDIWYTVITRNGTKYSKPRNAGTRVNSRGNDITPFYDEAEKTLYFSSDWHPGLGGYDIFRSRGGLRSLTKARNVGVPVNTSVDEYYYSQSHANGLTEGMLASNRTGSLASKGETCCNDLYRVEYPEPPVGGADSLAEPEVTINNIGDYLPITLYFHNDEPNPKTWDTVTSITYLDAYEQYVDREEEYLTALTSGLTDPDKVEAAEANLEEFMLDYLDAGVDKLRLAANVLETALGNGTRIVLGVKGYASPLAKSDYNLNLTLRRISSLENYLDRYKNGLLRPYLNGTAENGGKLTIKRIPYGETKADKGVSDELADQRSSVYSREAALERKIEILSIDKEAAGILDVAQPDHDFGKIPDSRSVVHRFAITNNGVEPLQLEKVETTCG
ncbi:MAG: DUF1573 domain-containing protein, partial [Bacteroidota bacterium]